MQFVPRHLISLTDTQNRAIFVFSDSIVSFTDTSHGGDNAYTMELSNGSQIVLSKEQCDKIIGSKLFVREPNGSGPAGAGVW